MAPLGAALRVGRAGLCTDRPQPRAIHTARVKGWCDTFGARSQLQALTQARLRRSTLDERMNVGAREREVLASLMALLIIAGLACSGAGGMLTPNEATKRARRPEVVSAGAGVEYSFQAGDTALLIGRSLLVDVLSEPGGTTKAAQERGTEVEVTDVVQSEREIWYEIDAPTGNGWVSADNLEDVPSAEPIVGKAGATGSERSLGEIDSGDTVYLTGIGYLVNLYDMPGGRLVAKLQRGAPLTVTVAKEQDGVTWYQVVTDDSQGWVAEANITSEAPQ